VRILLERRRGQVTAVLASLAEGSSGRADLATRVAITSQVGSHKGGSGIQAGPLLAITAGHAARNGLCRPPQGVGKVVDQGSDLRRRYGGDDAVGCPMCLCCWQRDRRDALTWRGGERSSCRQGATGVAQGADPGLCSPSPQVRPHVTDFADPLPLHGGGRRPTSEVSGECPMSSRPCRWQPTVHADCFPFPGRLRSR